MTAVACLIGRKPSFGASLDTLPTNPNLKAHPTVTFNGSTLEPLDHASGSRNQSKADKTYWKRHFKDVIKIAQAGHTQNAADLLKRASLNLLVNPFYLAITNVAVQNMNKPEDAS